MSPDQSRPPPLPMKPRKRHWKAPVIAVLALGAAGGAGYYAWGLRGKLRSTQDENIRSDTKAKLLDDDLKVQKASVADVGTKLETCQDELKTAKGTGADQEKKLAQSETELTACRANVTNLAQQTAEAKEQLDEVRSLTEKFQKMIDAGDLDVKVRRGKMVVKLPDAILFPSGSAELSDTGKLAIAQVGAILKQMPERRFTIAGHTDSVPVTGKFRSNWELSAARAVAVTETLVKMGLPASHLVAAGYGQYDPIASNDTKTGRQMNRRIEIILEPDIKHVPVGKNK